MLREALKETLKKSGGIYITIEGFHAEWHLEYRNETNMQSYETDIEAMDNRDV